MEETDGASLFSFFSCGREFYPRGMPLGTRSGELAPSAAVKPGSWGPGALVVMAVQMSDVHACADLPRNQDQRLWGSPQ